MFRHEESKTDECESEEDSADDNKEIEININLNSGKSLATVWTNDLSYEYIKINAEYRT